MEKRAKTDTRNEKGDKEQWEMAISILLKEMKTRRKYMFAFQPVVKLLILTGVRVSGEFE